MKIAVAGIGHVGTPLALLLARAHVVTLFDVDPGKVEAFNAGHVPVGGAALQEFRDAHRLDVRATLDGGAACAGSDAVFVAVPTPLDDDACGLDTLMVEQVACLAEQGAFDGVFVVRSTVPVGFCDQLAARHPGLSVVFAPEFMREAHCLADSLAPSRIVVGVPDVGKAGGQAAAGMAAGLLADACEGSCPPIRTMRAAEAEAVKLFSNAYLAMRVGFFNELDSFAAAKGLDAAAIIEAVSLDPRINGGYNKPSAGFGGACLPKDVAQLHALFEGIPQSLIGAIAQANAARGKALELLALSPLERVSRPVAEDS